MLIISLHRGSSYRVEKCERKDKKNHCFDDQFNILRSGGLERPSNRAGMLVRRQCSVSVVSGSLVGLESWRAGENRQPAD